MNEHGLDIQVFKSKAIEAQGDLHVYCMFIIKYYRKLGH